MEELLHGDASDSDLRSSDEEFQTAKKQFAKLLPRYGTLWRSMRQTGERPSTSTTTASKAEKSNVICLDGCCSNGPLRDAFVIKDSWNTENEQNTSCEADNDSDSDEEDYRRGRFRTQKTQGRSQARKRTEQQWISTPIAPRRALVANDSDDDDDDDDDDITKDLTSHLGNMTIGSETRSEYPKRTNPKLPANKEGKIEVIDLLDSSSSSDGEDEAEADQKTQPRRRMPPISLNNSSSSEEGWSGNDLFQTAVLDSDSDQGSNRESDDSDDDYGIDTQWQDKQENPVSADSSGSKILAKNRQELADQYFQQFDKAAFGGKLTAAKVTVTWSKRLNTTAGLTRMSMRTQGRTGTPQYLATVELSTKVLDRVPRLRSTLLHEMCHAAAFIIDHVTKPPHGKCFQKWAKVAMQAIPSILVTTTHQYEIQYKYAWRCATPKCQTTVQRHSRSINVEKVVCGRCRGKLVEIEPSSVGQTEIVPRKKVQQSAYNRFVQEQSQSVRRKLEADATVKVSQAMVMKECARLWKERKENTANS